MKIFKIKKRKRYCIIAALLLIPLLYSLFLPMPDGFSIKSEYYDAYGLRFLTDLSYSKNGNVVREHTILKEELRMIEDAEQFIIADLFLYNDDYPKDTVSYPNAVEQITTALIQKKQQNPDMEIMLITDPINNMYGSFEQEAFTHLKQAEIPVIITNLDSLPDSNPAYSGFYRAYLQWFGTGDTGWIPNPLDSSTPKLTLRSLLKLANFKANHRKLIVTEKEGIISSANPHDPSSYHSNVAAIFKGGLIKEILKSEKTVVLLSGGEWNDSQLQPILPDDIPYGKIRLLTEKAIYDSIITYLDQAGENDSVWIGMFYFSDFDILNSVEKAAKRGAKIRIVADPNKDAFGIEKNGSPNRPALSKLKKSCPEIEIKWYHTQGEQYHTKMIAFSFSDEYVAILGSGNFTRRNIKGFNLETDIEMALDKDSAIAEEIENYFNRIWNNENGIYTLEFDSYQDDSFFSYWKYKFQEATGISTF